MEYRSLGTSGLKVPALSLGTGTFGGAGPLFGNWGSSDVSEARRLIDVCLDAGLNMFDTADVYSAGASEEVLGEALAGRRHQAIISTKTGLPMGDGPNDAGTSRPRLMRSVDEALRRLRTDHIDVLQLHAFDAATPVGEVLDALDTLVRAGKVRYVGASNFAGWQLMKSLSEADRLGRPRHVAHQVYYSLVGRDYEWDLMPLAADQGVGALVWSPLGWGRLTGKVRRGAPLPERSRLHETADFGPPVDDERLYAIVDVLDAIAAETGRTIPQIALNWLLYRPTVSSVIIGARNEEQLVQNLGATGWRLTDEQSGRLDDVSRTAPPYRAEWRGSVRLNAGLLKTHYRKVFTAADGFRATSSVSPLLPSFSLSWQATGRLEVYASYSRGLEEAGTAPSSAVNRNQVLGAIKVTQREVGVRYQLGPSITAVAAAFETVKPYAGLDAGGVYRTLGDVTHRGVELSVAGSPAPGLSIVAGAALIDPKLRGVEVDRGRIGARPVGVPDLKAVASVDYALPGLKGLSADASFAFTGSRAARSTPSAGGGQLEVRSLATLNLGVRYGFKLAGHALTARLQVLNALDAYGWDVNSSETLNYNAPRRFRLAVTAAL